MLAIEDALNKILAGDRKLGAEVVGLRRARGRVLSARLMAPWDFPRFSYSAMDGYAVRAQDLAAACTTAPVRLPVTQKLKASDWPETPLGAGEAARIFTGAAIPPGADAVVMQEEVSREDELAIFAAPVPLGEAIRRQGEDLQAGEELLAAGTVLDASAIGLLASVGAVSVDVVRQPRVAILSCGDELVALGQQPAPGQIIESNRYALAAMVEAAGGIPMLLPLVPDDPEAIRAQIHAGLQADVLLTSGGASVGDYDLMRPLLEEAGVSFAFWKVAIKPGKPIAFGSHGSCSVFSLPGNPSSAMVTFSVFVRPLLRQMMGLQNLFLPRLQARLSAPARPTRRRVHFVRGQLSTEPSQDLPQFTPHSSQSSGNLLSMHLVDAMAVLPPGTHTLTPGTQVEVILLHNPSSGLPSWSTPVGASS